MLSEQSLIGSSYRSLWLTMATNLLKNFYFQTLKLRLTKLRILDYDRLKEKTSLLNKIFFQHQFFCVWIVLQSLLI
jgi:hypothetical protein